MTPDPANDSPAVAELSRASPTDPSQAIALRAFHLVRQAIETGADEPGVFTALGTAILAAGAPKALVDWLRDEATRRPTDARVWFQLARVLEGEAALEAYRRTIELAPGSKSARINRGNLLTAAGQLSDALEDYRQAYAVAPGDADAVFSLAVALRNMGRHREALEVFRQGGAEVTASADMHSRYLLGLTLASDVSREDVFQAHLRYGARFGGGQIEPHLNSPQADRRLKIGYVSGDLANHTVVDFVEPMLAHHEPRDVDVHVYSTRGGDTARIRRLAPNWRDVAQLDDDRLTAQIRADGIDILVDLSGHTGFNRLPVFGRKPSPVQVSFIGYPNTTGLAEIDYRLSDRYTASDETQAFLSESLYRLPDAGTCYRPFSDLAVAPPPHLSAGRITFGAPHAPAKLNVLVFDAWAAILRQVPESRLVLKYRGLADPEIAARISGHMLRHGVALERLSFAAHAPFGDYLKAYAGIDIVLDSFPYTGGSTTRNALWMGVPVVSLTGSALYERISAGLLSSAGLYEDCVAESQEAYVDKAVALARNGPRLTMLRSSLRSRLLETGYFDPARFVRDLEAAYRDMWRRWCATAGAS